MRKITSVTDLKHAIVLLETQQEIDAGRLKEHFYVTYRHLQPVNLLRGALKDLTDSPSVIENILGAVVGLGAGYLTKKIFIGTSGNLIRKVFGTILQLGITKVVAQHPEAIKSVGGFISQHIPGNRNRQDRDT